MSEEKTEKKKTSKAQIIVLCCLLLIVFLVLFGKYAVNYSTRMGDKVPESNKSLLLE